MTIKVFSGSEKVNFGSVIIEPSSALTFIETDLQKCLFLNTNLEGVGFIAVDWPAIESRIGVYDEIMEKRRCGGEIHKLLAD